jgi:peptide/nickel transport system substrate-binding protein
MPARSEGPLSDADVRKALFGSIDRAGLADVVFHGAAEPAYTLLAPNNWDPEARPQWEAAYGEFERANQLSVEDAKALVVGSGASAPIVVAVIAGDATMSQAAQLIQQSAKEIGLEVRIEALPPAKFSEAFFNEGARKDIDALLTSSFGATSDPVEQIEFLAMTGGFYNYVGYSNPRVDALLKRARRSFDPAERTTLLVEAQSIYEAESLATTVLTQNEVLYLRHGLTGATASFAYLFQPSLARVGADG